MTIRKLPALSFSLVLFLAGCGGGDDPAITQAPQQATLNMSKSSQAQIAAEATMPDNLAAYTVSTSLSSSALTLKTSGVRTDLPLNTTRIRFADISLALDLDGNAGKMYRLYQAAFNRTPDVVGLGYWIAIVDGGATLEQAAAAFLDSAEFNALYGTNLSVEMFVEKLYFNVLQRAPDGAGHAYWTSAIRNGLTRAQVLATFADSPENRKAVAPAIASGIRYAASGVAYRPVPIAGPAQNLIAGSTAVLDARASTDANGEVLRFSWTLVRPAGSTAVLLAPTTAQPSFKTDVAGVYVATLSVHDGILASGIVSTTTINATAPAVTPVADSGVYKCSNLSASQVQTLYAAGHRYLDRDSDGKPCEANDLAIEKPVVITPPVTGKQCYVNGYYRKNGTYVKGYFRSC